MLFIDRLPLLITLRCDASDEGMGVVLEQEQADGTMKPVLYWSSQFRAYDKKLFRMGEGSASMCNSYHQVEEIPTGKTVYNENRSQGISYTVTTEQYQKNNVQCLKMAREARLLLLQDSVHQG